MRFPHRSPPHKLFRSKQFIKSTPFAALPKTPSSPTHRFLFSALPSKPISEIHPLALKTSWISYASHARVPPSVYFDNPNDSVQMGVMMRKLDEFGIDNNFYKPGQHTVLCPQCKGGDSSENSLSLLISPNWSSAVWNCFRGNCGWKGSTRAFADGKSTYGSMNLIPKVNHKSEITEKILELEPMCDEVVEMKESNKDVNVNEINKDAINTQVQYTGSTRAFADGKSTYGIMNHIPKIKHKMEITEKSLELEPRCDEVVEMKKSNKDANVNEIKKDAIKWTEEMDDILLDALLEQRENGNTVDGTFTSPTVYSNVAKICSQKLGYPVEKYNAQNRMFTLRENFNTCFELFTNLSGISWSSKTKMFEGKPEVWKALIEAKPSASKWRHSKINHYGKLYELFAKDRANGQGFVNVEEKVHKWASDNGTSIGSNLDNYESNSECEGSSNGTKRKDLMVDIFEKDIEAIGYGINKVAELIEKGNLVAERGLEIAAKIVAIAEKARSDCHSDKEVYAELINIGVPDYIQLDAYLFLLKSSQHKSAFFGVPSERRLELLYKMMMRKN